MKNMKSAKGFTLIELLIVITIIGILAVAFLPSILGAPAKARDVARIGHLNQIATAIEAYAGTKGYPAGDICVVTTSTATDAINAVAKNLQGGTFPKDPAGLDIPVAVKKACADSYLYIKLTQAAAPAQYVLVAKMEDEANGNFGTTSAQAIANTAAPTVTDKGLYYIIVK